MLRPPFSPEVACKQFASMFKPYGIRKAQADRYAASWTTEQFQKHGITVTPVKMSKSQIYLECLPLFNSEMVELPNHKRLLSQLQGLERRVRSGGQDVIDHPQHSNAHDDLANSVCGSLMLAAKGKKRHDPKDYLGMFSNQVLKTPAHGNIDVGPNTVTSDHSGGCPQPLSEGGWAEQFKFKT